MATEKQRQQLNKNATRKALEEVEKHASEFLPKLVEYYFFYVLATWGLSQSNRQLFTSVFTSKINKDIKDFCQKYAIQDKYVKFNAINSLLTSKDHILSSEIFVRRLFLQYAGYHKNFITRIFQGLPIKAHENIVTSYLSDANKLGLNITKNEKKAILVESAKARKAFVGDVVRYDMDIDQKMRYRQALAAIAATLGIGILFYSKEPLKEFFHLRRFFNLPKDMPNFIEHWFDLITFTLIRSQFNITILALFVALFLFALCQLIYSTNEVVINYKENRRWNHFINIGNLPDEFRIFLSEQEKLFKEKLLPSEIKTPQITKRLPMQLPSNLGNSQDTQPFLPSSSSSSQSSYRQGISFFGSTPTTTTSSAATSSKPNLTRKELQGKRWQYEGKTIFYSSALLYRVATKVLKNKMPYLGKIVIKLWNESITHLSDYIFWEPKKIQEAIGEDTIYTSFALKAMDGHRTRAINGEGFVKKGGDYYEEKLLGVFTGDPRLGFREIATSTDPDSKKVDHLFAFEKYIPKAH